MANRLSLWLPRMMSKALNDLNLEELRASMLADFERVFPEYRLVPAEQLKVIPGPEETVCDTAEACEENLG